MSPAISHHPGLPAASSSCVRELRGIKFVRRHLHTGNHRDQNSEGQQSYGHAEVPAGTYTERYAFLYERHGSGTIHEPGYMRQYVRALYLIFVGTIRRCLLKSLRPHRHVELRHYILNSSVIRPYRNDDPKPAEASIFPVETTK